MRIVRIILPALCSIWAFGPATAQGQPFADGKFPADREDRKIEEPETIAKRRTDEMDSALELSKKQYKKVYKLYLAQEQTRAKNGSAMRPAEGGRPPQGGMHGGPSQRMGGAPGHMGGGGEPPRMAPPRSDSDKAGEEALENKMRKILTEEQYAKWDRTRFEAMRRRMPGDGDDERKHED